MHAQLLALQYTNTATFHWHIPFPHLSFKPKNNLSIYNLSFNFHTLSARYHEITLSKICLVRYYSVILRNRLWCIIGRTLV